DPVDRRRARGVAEPEGLGITAGWEYAGHRRGVGDHRPSEEPEKPRYFVDADHWNGFPRPRWEIGEPANLYIQLDSNDRRGTAASRRRCAANRATLSLFHGRHGQRARAPLEARVATNTESRGH